MHKSCLVCTSVTVDAKLNDYFGAKPVKIMTVRVEMLTKSITKSKPSRNGNQVATVTESKPQSSRNWNRVDTGTESNRNRVESGTESKPEPSPKPRRDS
jgi:hypothetical protein